MGKLISKILIKLIGSNNMLDVLDIEMLSKKIDANNVSKCETSVSKGINSKFYGTSIVENHRKNRDKIKIGENTHIRGELLVFNYGGKIVIGDDCFIGEGSRIWSGDSLTIGNDVLISHNVNIIDTNSHEINAVERSKRYKELLISGHWEDKGSIKTAPIVIEDFAWISFGVTILKGVKIGKGAIIGAKSVVMKDVPDWTIVAGNPAQVIREIPEDER